MGYTSGWEEVPLEAWAGTAVDRLGVVRTARLSTENEFPWFGLEAPATEEAARTVGRILAHRGEIAAVVALEPEARQVTFAVAFGDVPARTLILDDPTLAQDPLQRLVGTGTTTRLGTAANLARVLTIEDLGSRFFRAIKSAHSALADEVIRSVPDETGRRLALLQLTRVLFLYFIQSKGWLDGRTAFLGQEVDRCLRSKRSVQTTLLQPLFFGVLNQPAGTRTRSVRRFGTVPFLNGGLFEPHVLERRHAFRISNAVWRDVFDELFERFRFTAREANDGDRIAPDMLGRVFEGLMESKVRKTTGTYYTPTTLVNQLLSACAAAFVAHHKHVDLPTAHAWVDQRRPDLRPLWEKVTVLDPAVGSGAFLLGALHLLEELRFGKAPSASARREVVRRHLFGVDRDPMAVHLTELRLWLAIAAAETDDPSHVEPLPNLDGLVRQGDSLWDPLRLFGSIEVPATAISSAIARHRLQVFDARAAEKERSVNQLRAAETAAMRDCLATLEDRLRASLAECRLAATDRDLFGNRRGPDRTLRRRIATVRSQIRTVRRYRRQLDDQGMVPWFQFESHYADVFEQRGGFDLVVGNPPWVRAEELAPRVREHLRARYRWWRSGSSRGFNHQPDLAQAFMERGVELTAPDGVLGLLLPAKLLTAGYAAVARAQVGRATSIHVLADLTTDARASFDATTYPLALVTVKARPAIDHRVHTGLPPTSQANLRQRHLAGSGPWLLAGDSAHAALRRLDGIDTIGSHLTCHLGVKTGANRVFLAPGLDLSDRWYRVALRGRDVHAWRVSEGIPMLWPCVDETGDPVPDPPEPLRRHFEAHRRLLKRRADYRSGPLWQLFRTRAATSAWRVVWPDVARQLEAVALVGAGHDRLVPLNSCYVATVGNGTAALALTAWLNSTWLRALARTKADAAQGGYARFNARVVGGLPGPPCILQDAGLVELSKAGHAGRQVQDAIDIHVAGQLGLTSAECGALRQLT
jgi:hypothetical protein